MHTLLALAIVVLPFTASGGVAPYADGYYMPAVPKALAESQNQALPAATVETWLGGIERCHVYDNLADVKSALRGDIARKPGAPLEGGHVQPVELSGAALLGAPAASGPGWVFTCSVVSTGAEAIRLQVDLSGLGVGDQCYILSPSGASFGPYTQSDGRRWLASVQGDEAVLAVYSPRASVPAVELVAYSHVFLSIHAIAKELSCHVDIACEDDAAILKNATSTAIIMVAGAWFCSGTLINNEWTPEAEPFFLTANHCICSKEYARDTEVYWDFRSATCAATDAPDLDTLPRSHGVALLATDALLDGSLVKLDTVPTGAYGRMYAGWDAREPERGDNVYVLHFPVATHMRITQGDIIDPDNNQALHQRQIKVLWSDGVTESGSSGGGLYYAETNRLAGALSQGPAHSCGTDRSGNLDWFCALYQFYSKVGAYIDSPVPAVAEADDDCQAETIQCPFAIVYSGDEQMLKRFRAFRDGVLMKSAWGAEFVRQWYAAAPAIARRVQTSAASRAAFTACTTAIAQCLPPPEEAK